MLDLEVYRSVIWEGKDDNIFYIEDGFPNEFITLIFQNFTSARVAMSERKSISYNKYIEEKDFINWINRNQAGD